MEAEEHLTDPDLARWASGAGFSAAEAEAWSRHTEACGDCADLALALKGSSSEPPPPVPEPRMRRLLDGVDAALAPARPARILRWGLPAGAAAAAAILLSLSLLNSPPPSPSAGVDRLPEGKRVERDAEIRVAPEGTAEPFHLGGGSRFLADPGTVLSVRPAAGRSPTLLLIQRGSVVAEIAKADAGLRILAEAGEIRVTGTRLLVRVLRLHGASPVAVLSAEVSEGSIDLQGPAGAVRVPAGKRGILRSDAPPILQEALPLDWRAKALQWEATLASSEGAPSWEAAILLVNARSGGIDWRRVLDSPSEPAALRAIAARLLALCAEPEDAALLRDRFVRERDPAVRAALLPALRRLLGKEEIDRLLGKPDRK